MPDGDACTICAGTVNDNYTAHTFKMFICWPTSLTEYSVGNVSAGGLRTSHDFLEHTSGATGLLDARLALRRRVSIFATLDEITPRNLALMLNEDFVYNAGSCRIPLRAGTELREYGVRLVHTFPDGVKTLTIEFWGANIINDSELAFGDDWASFDVEIFAIDCSESHPTEEFGYVEINEACPAS